MNKQEVFDKAVGGVLSQGGPSVAILEGESELSCAYRGDNYRKCAIGHLIPDELYEKRFEGLSATSHMLSYKVFCGLTILEKEWLNSLQRLHDKHFHVCDAEFIEEFIEEAKAFAFKENLLWNF